MLPSQTFLSSFVVSSASLVSDFSGLTPDETFDSLSDVSTITVASVSAAAVETAAAPSAFSVLSPSGIDSGAALAETTIFAEDAPQSVPPSSARTKRTQVRTVKIR